MATEAVRLSATGIAELLYSPNGPVAQDLERRALNVEARMVELCPVDTGRLRGSITHEVELSSSRGLVARIGSNVDYAILVEKGTGLYGDRHAVIRPTTKQALFWPGARHPVKYVRGRKATPFIRPALDAARD